MKKYKVIQPSFIRGKTYETIVEAENESQAFLQIYFQSILPITKVEEIKENPNDTI